MMLISTRDRPCRIPWFSSPADHLKTLPEAGLVKNEPDGRQRTLTIHRDEVEQRLPGLLGAILN